MGDQHDAVGRIFGSPDSRARLQALRPDPEDFARFQQFMADEATMTGTKRFIGNQSSTADKLYEAADLSQVGEFVQHPIRASTRALAAALSRAGGMREKSGAEIARLLTDPSASLGAVERTRTSDALVRQLLRRGGAVSGGLAGGALGQTDGL